MNEQTKRNNVGDRLQIFAGLAATAFAVTLAVIVGNRLSDEALAVLTGAVCGVGAAIPTSLLIVAVTRRQDRGREMQQPAVQPQNAYPPVVVVAPPGGQRWLESGARMPPFEAPVERRFTVVGGGQGREMAGRWGEG